MNFFKTVLLALIVGSSISYAKQEVPVTILSSGAGCARSIIEEEGCGDWTPSYRICGAEKPDGNCRLVATTSNSFCVREMLKDPVIHKCLSRSWTPRSTADQICKSYTYLCQN